MLTCKFIQGRKILVELTTGRPSLVRGAATRSVLRFASSPSYDVTWTPGGRTAAGGRTSSSVGTRGLPPRPSGNTPRSLRVDAASSTDVQRTFWEENRFGEEFLAIIPLMVCSFWLSRYHNVVVAVRMVLELIFLRDKILSSFPLGISVKASYRDLSPLWN